MQNHAPTPDEVIALEKVKSGRVIDTQMLTNLVRAGYVDSLLGGPRVSKKGLEALGQKKRSSFYR